MNAIRIMMKRNSSLTDRGRPHSRNEKMQSRRRRMRWGIAWTVTMIPMARMARAPKEGNKEWPCSKSCPECQSFQINLEPCKAWQLWLKLPLPSRALSPIRCEYLEAACTRVLEPPHWLPCRPPRPPPAFRELRPLALSGHPKLR
jgi:hypothetical protein